jgi:hypothetical protein
MPIYEISNTLPPINLTGLGQLPGSARCPPVGYRIKDKAVSRYEGAESEWFDGLIPEPVPWETHLVVRCV